MSSTPRLHLISDRRLMPLQRLVELLPVLVSAGVDAVHLREKDLPGGELLDWAHQLRAAASSACLIVNERVDVALLAGADGVQLGERALPARPVRGLVGSRLLVGRSVHDRPGAERAVSDGADYLLVGNVYPTPSKPDAPGRGVELVAELARACLLPVIAIGGVTVERVPELLRAGAHGVAVISAVLAAPDPIIAARELAQALD